MEPNLTDRQKDELRELGNVGAGRASRYLSDLVDHRVDISIPDVEVVDLDDEDVTRKVFKEDPEEKVTAVVIPLKDVGGLIVFIFEQDDYQNFLTQWGEQESEEGPQKNFLEVSKKVGDFYIEALQNLLDIDLETEEPKLMTLDMNALTIHTTSGINSSCGPDRNCVLAINTDMEIADSKSGITMLLEHDQVEKILDSMEEQLQD